MHLPRLTLARRFALAIAVFASLSLTSARAADDFLPPAEAYKYAASVTGDQLIVRYTVHEGYYLYRDKLAFESATLGVTLGAPEFPVGIDHEDDYFGRQVIYRGTVTIPMTVSYGGAPGPFELKLKWQGCADA